MNTVGSTPEFDVYAADYDVALNRGLAATGEDREYFAAGRIHWLGRRLAQLGYDPDSVLDFGCGTGAATPHFFAALGVSRVVGLDVSAESLEVATREHGSGRTRFVHAVEFEPAGKIDLAFTNGVFHHVAPEQRPECLWQIHAALRPGGLFALWENNPWNPGTRYVMSRVPFDRDAQLIWPRAARRLLRDAGFRVLRTDYTFIFPRALKALRPLEKHLCRLPLGGQYMVLAQKR